MSKTSGVGLGFDVVLSLFLLMPPRLVFRCFVGVGHSVRKTKIRFGMSKERVRSRTHFQLILCREEIVSRKHLQRNLHTSALPAWLK